MHWLFLVHSITFCGMLAFSYPCVAFLDTIHHCRGTSLIQGGPTVTGWLLTFCKFLLYIISFPACVKEAGQAGNQ